MQFVNSKLYIEGDIILEIAQNYILLSVYHNRTHYSVKWAMTLT